MINILEYHSAHQPYFERLNRLWIEQHFFLEDIDKYVLLHPQEAIIDNGGVILMAACENQVAGTVALKKVSEEIYEFTKMAVDPSFRRQGIAMALSLAAIDRAIELGAEKIILYSQTILAPAIMLYRKLGFYEVELEPGTYKRANIKMEMDLQQSGKSGQTGAAALSEDHIVRFK